MIWLNIVMHLKQHLQLFMSKPINFILLQCLFVLK